MNECVILLRNPSNGGVTFIHNDEPEDIAVFPDMDAAIAFADEHPVTKAWPYQIVELDEL